MAEHQHSGAGAADEATSRVAHSSARVFRTQIVTPEETVLDEAAEFVALPLFDGEIGISPGRSPMIGRLGYGEMRIRRSGKTDRFFINGGFIEVAEGEVSILTNQAIPADQLKVDEATDQLAAARSRPANSEELLSLRERAQTEARAKLRMAQRSK